MNRLAASLGHWLARVISQPHHVHTSVQPESTAVLRAMLQPGDVLLVDGHSKAASAIKYLTQSSWSHAALYLGPQPGADDPAGLEFVEADVVEGVRRIGFEAYEGLQTRICRPVGLTGAERSALATYTIARIGERYDLRHVFDLARYLIPHPPIPARFRRRMIALGSGDPTRAICSTLVAQAFQSIRYPILPEVRLTPDDATCPGCVSETRHVRHYSLFTPRDFDLSPYFEIIKPGLKQDFDFHRLTLVGWSSDDDAAAASSA